MEKIPRQYYPEEFKAEAVKLVKESGLTIPEAGRRLSVPAHDAEELDISEQKP